MKVVLQSWLVGTVLGKGGATIKSLQERTGSMLRIVTFEQVPAVCPYPAIDCCCALPRCMSQGDAMHVLAQGYECSTLASVAVLGDSLLRVLGGHCR